MGYSAKWYPEWTAVRMEAFNLFEKGLPTSEIHRRLGISLRTAWRWKAKLKQLKNERYLRGKQ